MTWPSGCNPMGHVLSPRSGPRRPASPWQRPSKRFRWPPTVSMKPSDAIRISSRPTAIAGWRTSFWRNPRAPWPCWKIPIRTWSRGSNSSAPSWPCRPRSSIARSCTGGWISTTPSRGCTPRRPSRRAWRRRRRAFRMRPVRSRSNALRKRSNAAMAMRTHGASPKRASPRRA